ncbi:MAG: glycosyltransferase family 2 protein [Abditibacteriales bacterium]|nr:glycosyltransferase family 2 protein [Abditibacteriales bacterium]MDW8367992.1 glycosyltransferase family 2 protein [Abditibacteriales bacterium]
MLSIIIVNWNTCDLLRACLRSLRAACAAVAHEVIVVDNASTDGSAAMVAAEFPEVRLIVNAENVGYARGNNQGLERAQGEWLWLLNPDTEVLPNTVGTLLRFMQAHPDCGALGCKLLNPPLETPGYSPLATDHRARTAHQHSCRTFPTPDVIIIEALGLSRLFPRHRWFGKYRMTWWDYNDVREVEQPMASSLLLRREVVEQVGGMDEAFPIFFNDVDLCYRIKQAGWKIYFTPDAQVIHHGGASTRQVKPQMIRESHQSLLRFYEKHYRGKISPLLYGLVKLLVIVTGRLREMTAKL